MQGKHKKFDKKLFSKYDIPARETIKKCLGDFVCDNPDQFGADLLINSENCKYKYLELQVCSNWFTDNFPYVKPFVYARKAIYDKQTLFIITDKNFVRGLLFDRKSLDKEPKRLKKYSREFIYEVPWHRVLRFYLKYFDKDDVEEY